MIRIRYNIPGFYALRSAPGVRAELERRASDIAARANAAGKGTFATSSQQGARRPQGRWRTTVVTADYRAKIANSRHNILLRAMK